MGKYNCEICGISFDSAVSLLQHIESAHADEERDEFWDERDINHLFEHGPSAQEVVGRGEEREEVTGAVIAPLVIAGVKYAPSAIEKGMEFYKRWHGVVGTVDDIDVVRDELERTKSELDTAILARDMNLEEAKELRDKLKREAEKERVCELEKTKLQVKCLGETGMNQRKLQEKRTSERRRERQIAGEIENNSHVCPYCGKPLKYLQEYCECGMEMCWKDKPEESEEYECAKCGAVVRKKQNVCSKCGKQLDWRAMSNGS